jgi:hypothetical protein
MNGYPMMNNGFNNMNPNGYPMMNNGFNNMNQFFNPYMQQQVMNNMQQAGIPLANGQFGSFMCNLLTPQEQMIAERLASTFNAQNQLQQLQQLIRANQFTNICRTIACGLSQTPTLSQLSSMLSPVELQKLCPIQAGMF